MKRLLPILALLLVPSLAHATYVQSNKSDFATTVSTTACTFSSNVTAGNVEIMFAASNTTNAAAVTVSSARVSSWTKDQGLFADSGLQAGYLFRGIVTSTGAETVTATIASGTTTFGSACLEYSGTTSLNATSSSNNAGAFSITTTVAVTTIVEAATFNSATTTAAPFNNRQNIQSAGTTFASVGDVNETSTGTYSASFSNINTRPRMMDALSAPPVVAVPRHR